MKSEIIIKIKWFYRIINILLLWFISYNFYFGWNEKPENNTEQICDNITIIVIYILIGFFISIVLSYIKFKMLEALNKLKKQ